MKMYGLKRDWALEEPPRICTLEDYIGLEARWCPGCGDHGVLTAVQKVARDLRLAPEKTVVVSGIGCSSRFPHYMKTYGFHGLHGRAFPVACGIRSRRPDLDLFVVTGDGDCCAIGTGHWIHAVRYNMDMTVLLLDNNIYGLTKMQTSPTTRQGEFSNTHPKGSSFVAQTIDWNPVHLYQTILAAHQHKGFSFVRIFQRCPHFTAHIFEPAQQDLSKVLLMTHENGICLDEKISKIFPNQVEHDPSDVDQARELAARQDVFTIGLFFQNPQADRYDKISAQGLGLSRAEKLQNLNSIIDRFAI